MFTIYDYLDYYKNCSFEEVGFNQMDAMLFACLVYLPIKSFSENKSYKDFVSYAYTFYKDDYSGVMKPSSFALLNKIKTSKRYENIIISNFKNVRNNDTQFGAMSVRFNDNLLIAFKGSDSSLISWIENLRLNYQYPTYTQSKGIKYAKDNILDSDKNVYLVGHSKGGNLAMCAGMEIPSGLRDKVKVIYNFDGPGFLKKEYDKKFNLIKEKVVNIVPTGSVVGIICVVIILLLTAVMMIVWIYRSMITPIQKLRVAAENIKEGNLDFALDTQGDDEIGELCTTFEQMRQRLKDNAEEKLSNEKENRALISNIAHDLKTPITAVKGYSEGIMDGVANTPEKLDKYIRTIYNKANEMDTLINELTLYSKIDTNRIPYDFAKLNVAAYFKDCVEEIGLDLEAKGIALSYFNYATPDTQIIADPEQLRRVINNIIGNSVKYMNKTEKFINIRIKDVGDFIQVEIEDDGRGIAQKDLPYIFDRFYRTDASRNSATGGSGIGLSIVKKIIEDHGGKIWATSKEDSGTTMYFVIRKYQEVTANEQNTDR